MSQSPHLRQCEQCGNLVAKLFPMGHDDKKRELKVCASCYGLGLARQEPRKSPPQHL